MSRSYKKTPIYYLKSPYGVGKARENRKYRRTNKDFNSDSIIQEHNHYNKSSSIYDMYYAKFYVSKEIGKNNDLRLKFYYRK